MKRFLILLLTGIFCLQNLHAQLADSATSRSDLETKDKTTVTLAAIYASGIDYYGQTTDTKMPYLALNATVQIPAGFYFSATAFHLLKDSNLVAASALGVGYDFKLTKKLTGDLNYSHTFYPSNSPFLQAASPNSISGTLNYEYFLTTGLSADYNFGHEKDVFATISNSKNFSFNTSGNKAIVSFTPEFSVIAGTQRYYETYLIEKEKKNNGKGYGNNASAPGQFTTATIDYNRFGLLSYNVKLPISYNRSSYLIEAAWKLALLGDNAVNKGTFNSFLTLSVYYQF